MKGNYVDGFLLVVPKDRTEDYKKMASLGKEIWLRHGALDYKECMGDDLHIAPMAPDMPPPRSFEEAAGAKAGDTVWFSFIVFRDRKHRDEVNTKVMADPAMNDPQWKDKPMPMDLKRFFYGGFKVEVGL